MSSLMRLNKIGFMEVDSSWMNAMMNLRFRAQDKMDKEDQAFGLEEEEDMDLDEDDFEEVEMLTLPSHCVY
nr:hypothetical protein [Tanacetum cinerariifolium]